MIRDVWYMVANRVRLSRMRRVLDAVNAGEGEASRLSDAELRRSAAAFRERLALGATMDGLLPEAFARVREAARRAIGQRPFDVQVLGAVAMHRGMVAEMQTGEGKTLAATMPVFLNALLGRGVHVVTVNDYLAARDAEWMGGIYRALGLTVACITHGLPHEERARAYRADVTYGTNKEFAFDYLRDELRAHAARRSPTTGVLERVGRDDARAVRVQRPHHFAVVDEVDSILVDEARVPLIISSAREGASPYTPAYREAQRFAPTLREGRDYLLDVPRRRAELTNEGVGRCRGAEPAVPMPPGRPFEHLVVQALRAGRLHLRDRDYLVVDGKVTIVDEFTGRSLPDRSWSLGLHQAVECKEGVEVTEESRTEATVTFQRYFKLYGKLAGMTGTARESRHELRRVFGLRVVTIPTRLPMQRRHLRDAVFTTWDEKKQAVVERVRELNAQGRPVLVGTRSVRRSEELSERLTQAGIAHNVLNARQHAREAAIIAEAGQWGRVTIATNMAGRGVDIVLGGGVAGLGGLHVLGTERHEAGRIDRQLAGRAGRQGDPGSWQFFGCVEDELLWSWNRPVARLLAALARATGSSRPHWLYIAVFRVAQRSIEWRHARIRVDLQKYDKSIEEMKGHLGVPVWG